MSVRIPFDALPIAAYVVYAIGVKMELDPNSYTARGTSWNSVAAATVPLASPVDFTYLDKKNGSFGTSANTLGGSTNGDVSALMFPAVMRHGGAWQREMAWHFFRSLNIQWLTSANTSIINNPLTSVGFVPSQGGGASSSEVDLMTNVNEMNTYYSQQLAGTQTFRKADRIRLGSLGLNLPAGATAPFGNFSVDSSDELLGVTIGSGPAGLGLDRDMKNNTEYFKLTCPYLVPHGSPIGIQFNLTDQSQWAKFQSLLSCSNTSVVGAGAQPVTPPYVTDSVGIGGASYGYDAGAMERCSDDPTQTFIQQRDNLTYTYKWGWWKFTVSLIGREIGRDEEDMLDGTSQARAMFREKCGMVSCSTG